MPLVSSETVSRIVRMLQYAPPEDAFQLLLDAVGTQAEEIEGVQDIVGGMVTGNTESGITVTYDDSTGKLNFSVTGSGLDHGLLTGLSDDDHPQYPLAGSTETISGAWTFTTNPTISHSSPMLVMTDTDTGAVSRLNANSTVGNVIIDVDLNNIISGSGFNINNDGSAIARFTTGRAVVIGDFKCGDQSATGDVPASALHVSDSISNAAILTLTGTANDANPVAVRYERTRTGVANDVLIDHLYIGKDDAGNNQAYVRLRSVIQDPTNGSEDGLYQVAVSLAGTETIRADIREGIAIRTTAGGLPTGGMIAASMNAPSQYESGRKIGGVVASKFSSTGNVGTGVDTLHSVTVPAALLFNDGDMFIYKAAGTFGATANNKELVVKFGGVTLFTTGVLAINNSTWDLEVRVIKDGTDSYRAVARITSNSALITTPVQITASTALDLDAAQTFLVTGEATADNDIVLTQSKMNFNPA